MNVAIHIIIEYMREFSVMYLQAELPYFYIFDRVNVSNNSQKNILLISNY